MWSAIKVQEQIWLGHTGPSLKGWFTRRVEECGFLYFCTESLIHFPDRSQKYWLSVVACSLWLYQRGWQGAINVLITVCMPLLRGQISWNNSCISLCLCREDNGLKVAAVDQICKRMFVFCFFKCLSASNSNCETSGHSDLIPKS